MAKVCQYKGCTRGCYGELCILHKPRKPIKKIGKEAESWKVIRASWITRHSAPWYCYICGKWLDEDTLTLDHVIAKSNFRNYADRHNDDNLKPCCIYCNSEKGSK